MGTQYRPSSKRWLKTTLLCATLSSLFACSNIPKLPPLAENQQYRHNEVIWHDLITPNLKKSADFYQQLFGWQFEDTADQYNLIRYQGQLIGGAAEVVTEERASHWLPLISVKDVDATIDPISQQGGKALIPSFKIPGRGTVGVAQDNQGAVFGLIATNAGDPVKPAINNNSWLWHELWSSNISTAENFYQQVFQLSVEEKNIAGIDYHYFANSHKTPELGLINKPSQKMPDTLASYIKVKDVRATAERAVALGGSILMTANDKLRGGNVAIIKDPNGAGFIIQEMNIE
ncbi:hypothetical protein EDC56_2934 [Sinobacterium caligoides]|uniref:VOC domain-containing protein n=1 Tax=Sinobacterium caligoides TaxID=933926 RepID=A0A3N2DKI2_9GAMM|nr:VOC family protein [Sinobacterium caligoides]ROS00288.1 hypothetical protein EDC56_2934 [Sinobacterium caligoides]